MEILNSKKLKNLMILRCTNISQLAKSANVQDKIISKFLKADSNIRLSTLGKICRALNCSPNELLN